MMQFLWTILYLRSTHWYLQGSLPTLSGTYVTENVREEKQAGDKKCTWKTRTPFPKNNKEMPQSYQLIRFEASRRGTEFSGDLKKPWKHWQDTLSFMQIHNPTNSNLAVTASPQLCSHYVADPTAHHQLHIPTAEERILILRPLPASDHQAILLKLRDE